MNITKASLIKSAQRENNATAKAKHNSVREYLEKVVLNVVIAALAYAEPFGIQFS